MTNNSSGENDLGICIGTHSVVITPPIGSPTSLAGYAGKKDYATGIKDNLYANAVIIKYDGKIICFVACDLLGLIFDQVDKSREIFKNYVLKKDKIEIPDENITISSTHTHNGPDLYGIYNPEHNFEYDPDEEYLKILPRYIAGSLIGAYNQMVSNCNIGWEFGKFSGYSYNRRSHLPKCEINYRTVDTQFGAIKISDSNNKILSFILSFNAHPTTTPVTDNRITADYIHDIRKYLKAKYGNDIVILYLNGAFGDISPKFSINSEKELNIQVKIDDSTIHLYNFKDLMVKYGIYNIFNEENAKEAWEYLINLPNIKKQFNSVDLIDFQVENGKILFSNIENIVLGMEAIRQFIIWSVQTYQRKVKAIYGEALGKNFALLIDKINIDYDKIDLDASSDTMEYLVDDFTLIDKLKILKNSKFYFQNEDEDGKITKCGFKINISVIKLCDIIFFNIPAETINEISLRLRALITNNTNIKNTILIGNSNGYCAYLVTPEESKMGGYEPQFCFAHTNAYNIEKILIKLVGRMLITNIEWKKDFEFAPILVRNITEIDFDEIE